MPALRRRSYPPSPPSAAIGPSSHHRLHLLRHALRRLIGSSPSSGYRRILRPGSIFQDPLIESLSHDLGPTSLELGSRRSRRPGHVNFKAMLAASRRRLPSGERRQELPFKFVAQANLMKALIRTVEASYRAVSLRGRPSARPTSWLQRLADRRAVNVSSTHVPLSTTWGYHLMRPQ